MQRGNKSNGRTARGGGKGNHPLTGGHWESLSAAIICTFRCLLWDFPLDLTSLWSTCEETGKSKGSEVGGRRGGADPPGVGGSNPSYLRRGNFDVDDDGREGGFGELCWVVDGVRVQNHQLQSFGEFKYPLDLTLNLRCADITFELKLDASSHRKDLREVFSCRRWVT